MKRFVMISLLITWIAIPVMTFAETWVIDSTQGSWASFFQVTTFEKNVPKDLQAALDGNGLGGRVSYCGALSSFLLKPDDLAELPQDYSEEMEYSMALLALEEKDGSQTLVGMMKGASSPSWEITLANAGVLFPDRDFSITFTYDNAQMGGLFEIVYPREGGGSERYGLTAERYRGGVSPWFIKAYASVDDAGQGYAIDKSRSLTYGFQMADMPRSADFYEYHNDDRKYSAFVPFWLDYLGGLQNYPTTEAEIKALSAGSWDSFLQQDPAFTLGCNLRTKPTTSAKTLGMYNGGVRLTILENISGGTFGWYRVRIGEIEGYMSRNYVYMYDNTHFQAQLEYVPLPVVRVISAQALLESPGGDEVLQLSENTYAQVLAETPDGWLHVSISQKGVRWQLDPEAPTGYLHEGDVYTLSLEEHALVGQP